MRTSGTVRSAAGVGVNDTAYRKRKETYFRKVRFLIAVSVLPDSALADAERMFTLSCGFGMDAIQAKGKVNYIRCVLVQRNDGLYGNPARISDVVP